MKAFILTLTLVMTTNLQAETKKAEKMVEFKAHVTKIMMEPSKKYRVDLAEFAAVYHSEDKFAACLMQSMKENKQALLKVNAQSLEIKECTVK